MFLDIHYRVGQFMTDLEVCDGHSEGCAMAILKGVYACVNTTTSSETQAIECE